MKLDTARQFTYNVNNNGQADDDVLSSVFSKYGVRQPAELKGINGQVKTQIVYTKTTCIMYQ